MAYTMRVMVPFDARNDQRTFTQFVDEYLNDADFCSWTMEERRQKLPIFLDAHSNKKLKKITTQDLRETLLKLSEEIVTLRDRMLAAVINSGNSFEDLKNDLATAKRINNKKLAAVYDRWLDEFSGSKYAPPVSKIDWITSKFKNFRLPKIFRKKKRVYYMSSQEEEEVSETQIQKSIEMTKAEISRAHMNIENSVVPSTPASIPDVPPSSTSEELVDFRCIDFKHPHLKAAEPDEFINDEQMHTGIAGMIPFGLFQRKWQSIGILESQFMMGLERNRRAPTQNYLRVCTTFPDLIIMPWSQHGHWRLIVIYIAINKIELYDPLKNEAHEINNINHYLLRQLIPLAAKLVNDSVLRANPVISLMPSNFYNVQVDGHNCGIHCFRIAEEIIFTGSPRRLYPFNIEEERRRYYEVWKEMSEKGSNVESWPLTLQQLSLPQPTPIPSSISTLDAPKSIKAPITSVPLKTFSFKDKIQVVKTSILNTNVDVIVNAANKKLRGGGGIDKVIHDAAGPQLLNELKQYPGCETGGVVITNAYKINTAKAIIHAVGPDVRLTGVTPMTKIQLRNCYINSLKLAISHGYKTIAFPAISAGIFGYPWDEAAKIACEAVTDFLSKEPSIEKVFFCLLDVNMLNFYNKLLSTVYKVDMSNLSPAQKNGSPDAKRKKIRGSPNKPSVPPVKTRGRPPKRKPQSDTSSVDKNFESFEEEMAESLKSSTIQTSPSKKKRGRPSKKRSILPWDKPRTSSLEKTPKPMEVETPPETSEPSNDSAPGNVKKRGRPAKKQSKNQYTSDKAWTRTNFKDGSYAMEFDSKRSDEDDIQAPPSLIEYKNLGARRSTRLATRLPPLTEQTDTCYHKNRNHKDGCASKEVNHRVEYFDVGDFIYPCKYCGAWKLKWENETPSQARKCCSFGAVNDMEVHKILQDQIPEPLRLLCDPQSPYYKHFIQNSIKYNAEVSPGSISGGKAPPLPTRGPPVVRLNGTIEHNASGLEAPDGKVPRNAQVFMVELDKALEIRDESTEGNEMKPEILRTLHEVLNEDNEIIKLYKMGSELLKESIEKAVADGKDPPKFRLIIVDSREDKNFKGYDSSVHPHRSELPKNELVGMVWVNDDGEPPEFNGVWLHGRKGETQHIQYYSPLIEPLCYALLFPRGTQIYRNKIPLIKNPDPKTKKLPKNLIQNDVPISDEDIENLQVESEDEDVDITVEDVQKAAKFVNEKVGRKYVSRKQIYRYHMYRRHKNGFKEPHWLHSKGKLAHKFVIDVVNRAERAELDCARRKIQSKRMTTRKALHDFVQKNYCKGKKLGSVFTIPKNFKGGRVYMQNAYTNIMTIIDNTHLPSWFVTFTGNPNWPEIQRNIYPGEDQFDVKCRIFMAKAEEFLNDLFKKHVLGRCEAYHVVMEFQKRGMPHLHVVMIMEDEVTVADVDKYISARVPALPADNDHSPEAEQQRRLHKVIMNNNVHLCNENSGCQVNGKCTKGFKKPYFASTILHVHKPAQYERLPPKSLSKQDDAEVIPEEDEKADQVPNETFSEEEGDENAPELNYEDELRKDFDEEQCVEYERLPPPPVGLTLDETNNHLFGHTYQKDLRGGATVEIDDGDIVPYNPYLSLKYDCHINVECTVGQTGSPKYTCKYTTKGSDVVYAKTVKLRKDDDGNEVIDYNEAERHLCCRVMTACEAWMRAHSCYIFKQSHIVESLSIHLKGEEPVAFEDGEEEAADQRKLKDTQLTAFFKLCSSDPNARKYTYTEIPHHYAFHVPTRTWKPREHKFSKFLTRVHHVPAKDTELYALRLLLMKVKGPTSYEDLLTVNNVQYQSFVDSAMARGFWESDILHIKAIQEAFSGMRSFKKRRYYFAMIVVNNCPGSAEKLLDHFLDDLWGTFGNNPLTIAQRKKKALNYLEYIFQKLGTTCKDLNFKVPDDFGLTFDPSEAAADFDQPDTDDMVDDNGKQLTYQEWADLQKSKLNTGQQAAFGPIWQAIDKKTGELFALTGDGGVGKSYFYNVLLHYCKSRDKNVLPCASTGIAAQLLKNGQTAHNAFWIPKELDANTASKMKAECPKAEDLRKLDLIIIDEVSMLHKDALSYINKVMQDVRGNKKPFGGVVLLIGGDWKQLPPVVPKANPAQIVEASIKSWDMFLYFTQIQLTQNMRVNVNQVQFVNYLKQVGTGDPALYLPNSSSIPLDKSMMVEKEKDLLSFCYQDQWLKNPMKYADDLCKSAVLCPTNRAVRSINYTILNSLKSKAETYYAVDTPIKDDSDNNPMNPKFVSQSIEAMRMTETAGMPPHDLILKKGAIVMLIKNIAVFDGLCNGTRMQIMEMRDHNISVKVLTGPAASKTNPRIINLPRFKFQYGGTPNEPGPKFTRLQFPVKLAFAMTINKAQGQTLERVGIDFRYGPCFSHGQLYTALSRVKTKNAIRILPEPGKTAVTNVVWSDLLN